MDVTPPSTLRRLGIALAGLAVAALTAAACALSFDDLRALALTGEARPDLAFLYPAAFDALLLIALIGVLLLRPARMLVRVQAAFVLVLLIVAAAAVNVATAVRFAFDARQTAVGVALAPWIMLALALWLWLLLIKHVRGPERAEAADHGAEQDLVPFHRPQAAPPLATEAPAPGLLEPTPVVGPTAAPETPPVSTRVAEWPVQEEETIKPLQDPSQPPQEPVQPAAVQDVQEPEAPEEAPKRPVRWGDRVKPADVLVHPRPNEDDEDVDTQPHPVFEDEERTPDPAHGPETADESEQQNEELEDTAPHPVIHDDTPAPSGRLRSTPRPPDD
ncbi:hypothetical protein GCM10009850_106340 [Nonomuraea monospora]|uniref:DUF2637 domain-containing protein n=1 Tax=Nonomuraea monospora TaxID=568818 RepID=A0ABN3D060_9ACTN